MVDPTRPPRFEDDAEVSAPAAVGANPLQGAIMSPHRQLAIIDGSVVQVGGPVRGARLAGITDSSAVLQTKGSQDVMLMHPSIQKKRRQ